MSADALAGARSEAVPASSIHRELSGLAGSRRFALLLAARALASGSVVVAAWPRPDGFGEILGPLLLFSALAVAVEAPLLLTPVLAGPRERGSLGPVLQSLDSPGGFVTARLLSGWIALVALSTATLPAALACALEGSTSFARLAEAAAWMVPLRLVAAASALWCSARARTCAEGLAVSIPTCAGGVLGAAVVAAALGLSGWPPGVALAFWCAAVALASALLAHATVARLKPVPAAPGRLPGDRKPWRRRARRPRTSPRRSASRRLALVSAARRSPMVRARWPAVGALLVVQVGAVLVGEQVTGGALEVASLHALARGLVLLAVLVVVPAACAETTHADRTSGRWEQLRLGGAAPWSLLAVTAGVNARAAAAFGLAVAATALPCLLAGGDPTRPVVLALLVIPAITVAVAVGTACGAHAETAAGAAVAAVAWIGGLWLAPVGMAALAALAGIPPGPLEALRAFSPLLAHSSGLEEVTSVLAFGQVALLLAALAVARAVRAVGRAAGGSA